MRYARALPGMPSLPSTGGRGDERIGASLSPRTGVTTVFTGINVTCQLLAAKGCLLRRCLYYFFFITLSHKVTVFLLDDKSCRCLANDATVTSRAARPSSPSRIRFHPLAVKSEACASRVFGDTAMLSKGASAAGVFGTFKGLLPPTMCGNS